MGPIMFDQKIKNFVTVRIEVAGGLDYLITLRNNLGFLPLDGQTPGMVGDCGDVAVLEHA